MNSRLLSSIRHHIAGDEQEQHAQQMISQFVVDHENPFDRAHLHAHVVASALIVSHCGTRVLLGHHRKLDRWLQMGGHGEPGETSAESVAMREGTEESGIADLRFHPTAPRPFDIDVHTIPARKGIPEHLHLDIRYLLLAPPGAEAHHREDEHHELRWFIWEEALAFPHDAALVRLLNKAEKHCGRIS